MNFEQIRERKSLTDSHTNCRTDEATKGGWMGASKNSRLASMWLWSQSTTWKPSRHSKQQNIVQHRLMSFVCTKNLNNSRPNFLWKIRVRNTWKLGRHCRPPVRQCQGFGSAVHTGDSHQHLKIPRIISNFIEGLHGVEDVYWWSINPNKPKIEAHIRKPESDRVLLGFSQNELKRESTLNTTKNCTVRAYTPKSIPNNTHVTRTQRFSTKPQEKGMGESKNTRFQNFSKAQNYDWEVTKTFGLYWRPFAD
jgi:hypothetical protein